VRWVIDAMLERKSRVRAAIDDLLSALEAVSENDCEAAVWTVLCKTLLVFRDPLDGGKFSISELENWLIEILSCDVIRSVYFISMLPKNVANSHAVECADLFFRRFTDIILCSDEINGACTSRNRAPFSPIQKCQ